MLRLRSKVRCLLPEAGNATGTIVAIEENECNVSIYTVQFADGQTEDYIAEELSPL